MEIKKVAIIGAGAIGSYMVWGLSEKLGEGLCLVAEGERKEKLEKQGLVINGEKFEVSVKTPAQARGADLVFVCVKYGSLDSAIDIVEQVADDHTMVVSLLNGIDSEERIGARIGMEHLVYSVIKIASQKTENGANFKAPTGKLGIYYGVNEKNGSSDKLNQEEMVQALSDLFEGTPLCFHVSDDIMRDLWSKFVMNVSENLPQAIIGCGMGGYFDSEYVDRIRTRLREECIALATAQDIEINYDAIMTKPGGVIKHEARFSTLQDLDAKRPTEVDMLAGEAVRLGKKYGIPTPGCEIVYDMIRALEEKNEGKFDY